MKRDELKAILASVGRYIRRAFEPRIKAVEERVGEVPALVERAVAALPAAKDGKSVTVADVEPLLRQMVAAIPAPEVPAAEIERAVGQGLAAAVAGLPKPADGRDADPVEVARVVHEAVEKAVAAFPKPRDAEPVDVDAVAAEAAHRLLASDGLKAICDLVAAEAVAKLPPAEKGEDGKSVAVDDVVAALLPRVEERFEAIVAKHVLDIERRAQGVLERAVAAIPKPKDGRDGVDGKDGLSFDTATGAFDADRGYLITLAGAGRTAEFALPYMVHRGFWSEGKPAKAGESMTHDGALWIAKRDTIAKPCLENAEDWILAARKGRDGKDGRNGIDRTAAVKVGSNA